MFQRQKLVVGTCSLMLLGACLVFTYYSMFKWCPRFLTLDTLICVRLSANGEPRVGNPIELRVEVARRVADASKTNVIVKLPPEVELLDGDLEWQADLSTNKKIIRTLTVRVNQPGEWKIVAEAYSFFGSWHTSSLYLLSSSTVGKVSDKQSVNNWYSNSRVEIAPPSPQLDERFTGVLTLSGQPQLNQEITATYVFTTLISLSDVTITTVFPPHGFEIISTTPPFNHADVNEASVSWMGDLQSNQTIRFIVTFRITDVGRGSIFAYSFVHLGEGETSHSFVPTAALAYLEVTKYSGNFKMVELP